MATVAEVALGDAHRAESRVPRHEVIVAGLEPTSAVKALVPAVVTEVVPVEDHGLAEATTESRTIDGAAADRKVEPPVAAAEPDGEEVRIDDLIRAERRPCIAPVVVREVDHGRAPVLVIRPRAPAPASVDLFPRPVMVGRPSPGLGRAPRPAERIDPNPGAAVVRSPPGRDAREPIPPVVGSLVPVAVVA